MTKPDNETVERQEAAVRLVTPRCLGLRDGEAERARAGLCADASLAATRALAESDDTAEADERAAAGAETAASARS